MPQEAQHIIKDAYGVDSIDAKLISTLKPLHEKREIFFTKAYSSSSMRQDIGHNGQAKNKHIVYIYIVEVSKI